MIDLINIASSGKYVGGQLVDKHNTRDSDELPWQGSDADSRGFVRILNSALLEDNQRYRCLQMHPKWVDRGTIKGWLPWRILPENAIFKASIGFLEGAENTDGVTFQVWAHYNVSGRRVWNRVTDFYKTYTGALVEITADLSYLSEQNVGIELRVDAGKKSGQDWAVWVSPQITSRELGPGYAVISSNINRIEGNQDINVYLPKISGLRRGSRTLYFVDSFSYNPEGDDNYSYSIETLNPNRLPSITGDLTVSIDEEYSVNYKARTAAGKQNSEFSFRVKAFEIPSYVKVKRNYIVLKGAEQTGSLQLEVPPEYKAVTLIEVLEYDSANKKRFMYATRSYAVGRTIIVNAFSDYGNNDSRVVLRVTCLFWSMSIPAPDLLHKLDKRRTHVSKGGFGTIPVFLSEKDRHRFFTTPTMHITDEKRYVYSLFENEDLFFEGLSEEAIDKFKKFNLYSFIGSVGDAAAAGISIKKGDAAKAVENISSGLIKLFKSFKKRSDHRDPDAAYFIKEEVVPPFGNRQVSLQVTDAKRDSIIEVTMWVLKFPVLERESSQLYDTDSRTLENPPKYTYSRWKHAALGFADYLFPEQAQDIDSKDIDNKDEQ